MFDFSPYIEKLNELEKIRPKPADYVQMVTVESPFKTYEVKDVEFNDKDGYQKAFTTYNIKYGAILDDGVAAVFDHYGVTNNPKKHQCWALAWQYGHSAGYQEVVQYFDELVVLIKE